MCLGSVFLKPMSICVYVGLAKHSLLNNTFGECINTKYMKVYLSVTISIIRISTYTCHNFVF